MSISCLFKPMGGSVLPPGYRECEYLETDGFQYIDTGITPGSGYGFSITYYAAADTGTSLSPYKLLGSSIAPSDGMWGGIIVHSWASGNYSFFAQLLQNY